MCEVDHILKIDNSEKKIELLESHKKGFKISVRFNEAKKLYECYKIDFQTEEEEIIFQDEDLDDTLKRTQELYNSYAKKLAEEL